MEVFTIDLTLNLMLPLVVLTHATTRISKSTDSSILNLLNTNTPIFDYEIPLKSLDHQQLLILFTAISDLLVPLMCRRNSDNDFEMRRHSTFYISKEHLPSHNKMCIRVSFKYIVKYVWNPTHLMGLTCCWALIKFCFNFCKFIFRLMCRRNSSSNFEMRRHSTFLSQKSTFQVITKCVLGFLLNT